MITLKGHHCPIKIEEREITVRRDRPINRRRAHGKHCVHWIDDGVVTSEVQEIEYVSHVPFTDDELKVLRPFTWAEQHKGKAG